MAKAIKIRDGQNLFDIALQELGTIEAAPAIAALNNITLNDVIQPNTDIMIPEAPINSRIRRYYLNNDLKPATNYPAL